MANLPNFVIALASFCTGSGFTFYRIVALRAKLISGQL
jgi:hypothetical protein